MKRVEWKRPRSPCADGIFSESLDRERDCLDTTPRSGDSVELVHPIGLDGRKVTVLLTVLPASDMDGFDGQVVGFGPTDVAGSLTSYQGLGIDDTVAFDAAHVHTLHHGAVFVS